MTSIIFIYLQTSSFVHMVQSMKLPANINLSNKQKVLIEYVLDGEKIETAGLKAGYCSEESVRIALRKPTVASAIKIALAYMLVTESAPLAIKTLNEIVKGKKNSAAVRVSAAKTLLDRAGLIAPKAQDQGNKGSRDVGEMDSDELRELIDELAGELGERAQPVEQPALGDLSDLV